MKIALISDELTRACLASASKCRNVTGTNYKILLKLWKPDLLFVESTWNGVHSTWKYRVASYPDCPHRNNSKLASVVRYARDRGIPTVFWNKEDGVHFDRFIASASLFDHIFTVDANCIPRYRSVVDAQVTVAPLMFPVQPSIHNFIGFRFKYKRANFVGSYGHHVHRRRRQWQDAVFRAAQALGVTVFDRNSARGSDNYRYPNFPNMEVRPAVPHALTATIYRDFVVSLNVNTVDDSSTMYSRRLVEILACGGIAVTSPAPSVATLFKDYCHVVSSSEEARDLFDRLKHGPSCHDLERARAGAEYVLREHTWSKRLEQVAEIVGL